MKTTIAPKYSVEGWLAELRMSTATILVEGRKDKEALEAQGVRNIKTVAQKPLFKTVEELAEAKKQVIILTDLDVEGRKYYSYLKHHLQKSGVKVDRKFREFLFKNTNITQIESMKRLI